MSLRAVLSIIDGEQDLVIKLNDISIVSTREDIDESGIISTDSMCREVQAIYTKDNYLVIVID